VYVDPSGGGFLKWVIPAIVITALILVAVFFPPLAIVIGTGMLAGGLIGGLSAGLAGGDAASVMKGVLAGAAVGGLAALTAHFAGPTLIQGLGLNGFWGSVVSSAVRGVITGAAAGFASGYAGGRGSFDDVVKRTLMGALLGGMVGGVLGAWATHAAPNATPWEAAQQPTKDLGTAWNKAVDTSSLGSLQEARETTSNWIDVANRAINLPQETLYAVSQNLLDHIAPELAQGELAPLVFVDAVVALHSQNVGGGWIFDVTLGLFGKDVGRPLAAEGVNPLLRKVFA